MYHYKHWPQDVVKQNSKYMYSSSSFSFWMKVMLLDSLVHSLCLILHHWAPQPPQPWQPRHLVVPSLCQTHCPLWWPVVPLTCSPYHQLAPLWRSTEVLPYSEKFTNKALPILYMSKIKQTSMTSLFFKYWFYI